MRVRELGRLQGGWRDFLRALSRREKTLLAIILTAGALVSFGLAAYDYWIQREPAPARGGSYTEGMVGEPRFLNPLLSVTNEIDRELVTLLFAGLTRHGADGSIIGDLAEAIEVESRGRVYKFTLRDNLRWSDGEPLTADDVVFTVGLIQNPLYQIPLRSNWQGVRAEKVGERTIQITLPVPFASFLENTNVGILPQHLWENVEPQNFAASDLNLKPVGAGPYVVKKLAKNARGLPAGRQGSIGSIKLTRNNAYHNDVYIDEVALRFYDSEDALTAAYRRGEIEAMSLLSPRTKKEVAGRGGRLYTLRMPRYFAVFFNEEKNAILKERSSRLALAHATDRTEIIKEIFNGEAIAVEGPITPWYFDNPTKLSSYEFSEEKARALLADADLPVALTLTTVDIPELTQVASILKKQWERVGLRVNLDIIPANSIQQQTIRPREYEALLFGEVLGIIPDPFSFWHSSQIKDPGLNLSLYENKKADDFLESARQTLDEVERQKLYEEFEGIVRHDVPAIFLYNPNYLYALPAKIKGFSKEIIGTPAQRFEGISDWYIKTKRKIPGSNDE